MEHYRLYHDSIPPHLAACAAAPCMQRLTGVGMNCGCEYTSFPRFLRLHPYSRFDHSLGVALIVWHFTHDEKQSIAGLLHDAATPVFAHVVDFLNGDYLAQESTEDGTAAILTADPVIQAVLSSLRLCTDDVCDYHRYPIADNDSPRLSADRLEYTLGNCLNYGIRTEEQISAFYSDLTVGVGEDGQAELAFRTPELARDFTAAALNCSEIYVSEEDRYAMQMLSELLKFALSRGVLTRSDLCRDEPTVIRLLGSDAETAARWRTYRAMRAVQTAEQPNASGEWRRIYAKKRYIDPLILGFGRVSAYDPALNDAIRTFLERRQDLWICAEQAQSL